MNLPKALAVYDQVNEQETRQLLVQENKRAVKKGDTIYFDRNEVILSAPNGSRWALVVSNLGALSTVARP